MRVHPFRAVRPPAELAARVAAVPYDVVDTEEARLLAKDNPLSLLHVSRPEIDFPAGWDLYADEVYVRGAENFARLQAEGALAQDAEPGLFVYSQRMGTHAQYGVVGCCDVDEYNGNVIRRHEKTRVDKENDRVRHIKTLHAQTGPVFLAYRDDSTIDRLVASAQQTEPLCRFVADDGIEHTAWRLPAAAQAVEAFRRVSVCYIADGHHRAAAAARAAVEDGPGGEGSEERGRFLAILYPAGQLQIYPINRCVKNLNGLSEGQFLAAAGQRFRVEKNADPRPGGTGQIRMYLGGTWYGLTWGADRKADPVACLDVSVLQDRLFSPVLGIQDPRIDPRLDFVAGTRGTGEIARRVDSGESAAGFAMHPVTIDQVIAVADAGQIMPPKSTFFAPKPRSGLFVHVF